MQQPSFDNWTILFLNFSFIGFLLFFFFWFRRSENQTANRLVSVYVLLYAIMMVEYVLYWTHYLYYFPHWTDVSAGFPFLLGPLLFLYFKTIYEKKELKWIDLAHAIPFLLFILLKLPFYLSGAEQKRDFGFAAVDRSFIEYWRLVSFMPWIKILHNCIYVAASFFYVKRQETIADIKRWSYALMLFFILFIISSVAYYVLIRFPWFNSDWDYFISFVMSAGILCTAWFALAYPSIFSGFGLIESVLDLKTNDLLWKQFYYNYKTEKKNKISRDEKLNYNYRYKISDKEKSATEEAKSADFLKYKNSGLTERAGLELLTILKSCMEMEKLYRENAISLEFLAGKTGTTKHNLSQVINERIGMSFFDYINHLRITEAMQLLRNPNKQKLTIIEIAYDVGFNNKVTFNAAFKKITGLTPGEFRKGSAE